MQTEDQVILAPPTQETIKNIILEKKGKKLGGSVIRQVSIINGKMKQNAGSGGGCMGGPAGREYEGITKLIQQPKDKFGNDWCAKAQHQSIRFKIEFQNRSPVYVYVKNAEEALKLENLINIDESGTIKKKNELSEVKGSYKHKSHKNDSVAHKLLGIIGNKKQQQPKQVNWYNTMDVNKQSMYTSIVKKDYNHNESKYAQAKAQLSGKFTDQEFPPNMQSLTSGQWDIASKIEWKRAEEFLEKGKISIFEGKIEPNDIKQGQLGDCYYLCSLSALAERQNLVRKLFETVEYQEDSMYCVWLCIDGEFQQVILDDYFPTLHGKPAFSRANGPELWVLLMEKAYAKCFGNYQKIEAGLTGLALRDLTGAPHEWIATSEGPELVWEFINYHDDPAQGHIMTAGTQAGQTRTELDMGAGIVSGHAYAILDHKTVNAGYGNERIIQLRNPWGQKEWTGRWSDKSDVWTPALKKECNVKDENDGVFWISIDDFCKQFNECTTNMLYENYKYSSQRINMKQQNKFIVKFNVRQQTKGYIQLSQKDKRHYGENSNYKYSYMKMIICKSDFTEYMGDEYSCYRDFYINGEFTPGEYYAYVETCWDQNRLDADSVVISSYSEGQIQFDEDLINDYDEILNSMLAVKTPENPQKVKTYPQDNKITRFYGTAGGFLYFRWINESEESILKETINMKKHDYLTICPPEKNSDQFSVQVKPGQVKVIRFDISPEGNGGYSLSLGYSTSVQLGQNALLQTIKQANSKQRTVQGKQTQVKVYTLFNQDGLFLLYENNDSRTYKEDLNMKLTNLRVEPDGISTINISLQPGQTKLIKCSIIDPNQGSSFSSSMLCSFE